MSTFWRTRVPGSRLLIRFIRTFSITRIAFTRPIANPIPVHWGAPPEPMAPGCWYIMRHDDARFALDDPRFCVEIARAIPPELLPPIPEPFRPFFEQTG